MAQLTDKQLAKVKKLLLKFNVVEDEAEDFIETLKSEPDDDELEEKEEAKEPEKDTSEEIDEAKADIEEKGGDEQDEKDRVDESVGEQEKLDGKEDSQDAKDRVDEAEGEAKHEDYAAVVEELKARLDKLEERLAEKERQPQKVDDEEQRKFDEIKARYLN